MKIRIGSVKGCFRRLKLLVLLLIYHYVLQSLEQRVLKAILKAKGSLQPSHNIYVRGHYHR